MTNDEWRYYGLAVLAPSGVPGINTSALRLANNLQNNNVKTLILCPACQQGLERDSEDTKLQVEYILVELAKFKLGEKW